MTLCLLCERVEVIDRVTFLATGEVGVGQRAGEPVIALWAFGEHQKVRPGRVSGFGAGHTRGEGEFGAKYGSQLVRLGRFSEPDDSVEAIVVGNRQGIQPQSGRFGNERFGGGDSIEKTETAVHVEFGVVHVFLVGGFNGHRLVGLTLCRPGGRVGTVSARGNITAWPAGFTQEPFVF